jgi:histone H3
MARTKASAKKSVGGKTPAKKAKAPKAKGGKRKYKPGTVALREIRKIQKTGALLLKKAPFQRLVRAAGGALKTSVKFKPSALAAVQEAAEAYATSTLEGAVMLQLHRKRKTLVKKDIEYVRRIKGEVLDA